MNDNPILQGGIVYDAGNRGNPIWWALGGVLGGLGRMALKSFPELLQDITASGQLSRFSVDTGEAEPDPWSYDYINQRTEAAHPIYRYNQSRFSWPESLQTSSSSVPLLPFNQPDFSSSPPDSFSQRPAPQPSKIINYSATEPSTPWLDHPLFTASLPASQNILKPPPQGLPPMLAPDPAISGLVGSVTKKQPVLPPSQPGQPPSVKRTSPSLAKHQSGKSSSQPVPGFSRAVAPIVYAKGTPAVQPQSSLSHWPFYKDAVGDLYTLPGITSNLVFPKGFHSRAHYPDATQNQKLYVQHILKQLHKIRKNRLSRTLQGDKLIALRFAKGMAWDLKGKPGLPPPGFSALYKGVPVQDNYFANNAYGHAMAEINLSLIEALALAQVTNIFDDQPEDQVAIISGWFEYYTSNPWPNGLPAQTYYISLKQDNPKRYREEKGKFYQNKNILLLLLKAQRLYQSRKADNNHLTR